MWTDRSLVIIMIAVEMVMVGVTGDLGYKACLGWFLLLSTSFMPLPI